MNVPADLFYTKEHEWVKIEDNKATIGITDYAQSNLGDITYVELPKINDKVEQFKSFSVVESVKAASDVYAPLSGEVIEVNEKLEESPQAINQSPYNEGWFIVIKTSNLDEKDKLMSQEQYQNYLKTLE